MIDRRVAARCSLAASILLSGCFERPSMWNTTPPTDWAAAITAERKAKDAEFAADPESPLRAVDRASFRALEYWTLDPEYRFTGFVSWLDTPVPITIVTTTGKERQAERVGRVTFTLRGTRCSLTVFRLLDQEQRAGGAGLFLPFTDGTTGSESYPAGRYVELEGPEGGPFVLDFNRSYNPYCAYGSPERYRCPVTPAENKLPVRVEAGERGFVHTASGA